MNTFARQGDSSNSAILSPREEDRRVSRIADMVLPRPDMESILDLESQDETEKKHVFFGDFKWDFPRSC